MPLFSLMTLSLVKARPSATERSGCNCTLKLHLHRTPQERHSPKAIPTQRRLIYRSELLPYFTSSDSKRALYEHLSRIGVDERKDYLANLANVMNEAKVRGELDDDVINTYYELKDSQIELAKDGHSLRTTTQIYILSGAASTLFLIALFSLISLPGDREEHKTTNASNCQPVIVPVTGRCG